MPSTHIVDTTASLTVTSNSFADGDLVKTLGYHTKFDDGGNEFIYHASGRPSSSDMDEGFFVTGNGADDYYEAIDKSIVNVKKFGTHGDPTVADDTALQNAVKSWNKDYAGRLHFPRGKYHITQTLDLGGGRVVGNIVTSDGPNTDNFTNQDDKFAQSPDTSVGHGGASIVWTGTTPAPMISYDSNGLVWDGPALWGKYLEATHARATKGFEVTLDSGVGTGKIHFRQLHVSDVDIALHANGSTNVDLFQVDRFKVRRVETGFRSENSQNTGNLFGYVNAHTVTGSVFDFALNAHSSVNQFVANNSVNAFVRSDGASAASGSFSCKSMKIDPASSNMILVDAIHNWLTHGVFTFENITGYGQMPIKIRGEASVIIRDSQVVASNDQMELIGTSDRKIVVEFQHCQIPSSIDPQTATKSADANCRVIFRNCYGNNNLPRASEVSIGNGAPQPL